MTESTNTTQRHVRWCFTLNNWTEQEYDKIIKWDMIRYLIVGKEIGESGTPHLQGYVEWTRARFLSPLKKLNKRIHWAEARAEFHPNREYCSKEGDFFELGEPAQQGKRNDLLEVREMVDNGVPELEIANTHFSTWANNYRALERYQRLRQQHRTTAPQCIWLWGSAGVGKTRSVIDNHEDVYIKDGTKWWDGYNNNEVILIDDFDGQWPFRDLLRLLDRYPYQGQIKTSYVNINSSHIYITCEHPPDYYWGGNELAQITRRLSLIKLVEPDTEVQEGNTMLPVQNIQDQLRHVWEQSVDDERNLLGLADPSGR